MNSKPLFSFEADSPDSDNKYGMASWQYTHIDGSQRTVKQRFASFEDAWAIDNLLNKTYFAGIRLGQNIVCEAVERVTADYYS